MVNLQDISSQLMKPAKELASWNFPLSEILEEYYSLLEGHCNVNFGEAALILQNSVDIYVRRVECLLDETAHLNETFTNYEAEYATGNDRCDKKRSNKNSSSLDDFKLCDLEEEVGKNINTKNKYNIEKPVKLLTRRFAQLESMAEDLAHNMTEIIDIRGDVIGKKYHFRCNQYLNTNGLLIDEPTPDDFGIADMESSATSGYCSNTSIFDSSYNLESNLSALCATATNNNTDILTNCCLSPLPDSTDSSIDIEDFNVSNDDTINEKERTTNIVTADKLANFEKSSRNRRQLIAKCNTNTNDVHNTDHVHAHGPSRDSRNHPSNGRSKEMKRSTDKKKTVDSKIWEPVSLACNISTNKKRSIDRLKTTSSIISKTEIRKRKMISQMYKGECVVNFLLRESKLLPQKSSAHVSKKQALPRFKTEEIAEIHKVFEDCFKKTESLNLINSETSIGRDDSRLKKNLTEDNTSRDDTCSDDSGLLATSSSFLDCEVRSASPTDSIISRPSSVSSQLDSPSSLPNYERLIEHKMKELFEESDVRTELDRKVNKWHQSIQSKLAEVEQKPMFRMHDYTSRIIQKLQSKNHSTSFDSIVDGEHNYEVARYFLALLQLANTYNVDISSNKSIDEYIEILLLDRGKNT